MTDHPLNDEICREVADSMIDFPNGFPDAHDSIRAGADWQLEHQAQWDVIGNGSLVIFLERRRIPNRWVRFWTRVFFTSKWQLPEDN